MGLLAETFAGLAARGAAQLGGFGLSSVEFEVLLRLARSPAGLLRMTDLTAQTTLTSSGVTRVVDRLCDRGLVVRQACDTDRRTTYAVVTERGQALLAEILPAHLDLIETLAAPAAAGRGRRVARDVRAGPAPGARPRRALRHGGQRGTALPRLPLSPGRRRGRSEGQPGRRSRRKAMSAP